MMMLRYKKGFRKLEYCNNYLGVPGDRWEVAHFNHFTKWFISYVGVKAGFGLAPYLGYSNNIDNQEAVAWWLEIKMKHTPWPFYSLSELRNEVRLNAPNHFFSLNFFN